MNQNTGHPLRTVLQRIKIVGFLLLFIVFIGNTQLTGQQAYAQGAICADRPADERGIPPTDIWVEINTHYGEFNRDTPFAQPFSFDFYISGVLLGELGDSPDDITNANLPSNNGLWADAALEALAVAVRSFTWSRLNYAGQFPDPYDPHAITLDNTNQCGFWDEKVEGGQQINAQTFRPYQAGVSQEIRDHYNAIVTQHVPDIYMAVGGGTTPIDAQYRATVGENSDPGGKSYLISIFDPISAGDTDPTNASGMGQWGAQRWTMGLNDDDEGFPCWNYRQILAHYYTDIDIREGIGTVLTPDYRWNALEVEWFGIFTPPVIYPGGTYTVTVVPQNTGDSWYFGDWTNFSLGYYWQRESTIITGTTTAGLGILDPGDGSITDTVILPVVVPSTFNDADVVTLNIDVLLPETYSGSVKSFLSRREGENRPWYPLKYVCEIGQECHLSECGNTGANISGGIYLPIITKNSS